MAEIVIMDAGKTFILHMTEENMERLTFIVTQMNSDYYEAVLACFHAGLVLMSVLTMEHLNTGDLHEIQKEIEKSFEKSKEN